jgi:drug/metabolite transporter (DMT)-like permease
MKVLLVWLVLCAIWSSTWIFIKFGLDEGLPPVSFAAARFIIAAVVLSLILTVRRISLPNAKRDWQLVIVTGLMQFGINYGLLFWGEQYISSGLAAVLQATIPAFGLVIAQLYLPDEPITIQKILAILLGIGGVAIIFYEQLNVSGALAFAGCAAIVVGAFVAAYSSILVKAFGGQMNSVSLLAAQMICGMIPLSVVGFLKEGNPLYFRWTPLAIFSVFYLALLGSIAAFWLYYWLLKNMDATKAMMISLVTPFVAVLIGNWRLGETLQRQTLVGGALILLSVGMILLRRR